MGPMRSKRGSNLIGLLFLLSVFGPMVILGAIWAYTSVVGGDPTDVASLRAGLMDLMIWVLIGSGVVLIVDEILLLIGVWTRGFPPD